MKASDIDCIIIHCSATREGQDFKAADIDRWHRERGFAGIGYHYVIDIDGKVEEGRALTKQGAHTTGWNSHSIGVCYIGGLDKDGRAKDTRTEAQKAAMDALIYTLKVKYPITDVLGHRDASPDKNGDGVIDEKDWIKTCPCFDVREEYPMAKIIAKRK